MRTHGTLPIGWIWTNTPSTLLRLRRDLGLSMNARPGSRNQIPCVLPGFVKAEAMGALQSEGKALAQQAFFYEKGGLNCYRRADDPRYPADHPRRLFYDVKEGVVAYDQFPQDSRLTRIYLWQPLSDFLARVFEKDALYPFGDPFQALNIMVLRENPSDMGMGWHFDENEFTITLMDPAARSRR